MRMRSNNLHRAMFWASQLVMLFFLIPFIAHTFTPQVIGALGLSQSVAECLVVIGLLGVVPCGYRLITQARDDTSQIREIFWSVYGCQIVSSFAALLLFAFFLTATPNCIADFAPFWWLWILSAAFDVSWYFAGTRDFKTLLIASAFWKIIAALLLVLFVQSDADARTSILILSGTLLAHRLCLAIIAMRRLGFVRPPKPVFVQCLKDNILTFVSIMALCFFGLFDKLIVGILDPLEEVSYFAFSAAGILIALLIVVIACNIKLPRVFAQLDSEGDSTENKRNLGIWFAMAVAFCAMFCLEGILPEFTGILFGAGQEPTLQITMALTPIIPLAVIVYFFAENHLRTGGSSNRLLAGVLCAGLANVVLCLIWIPNHAAFGAAAATLFSTVMLVTILVVLVYNELPLSHYMKSFGPFCVIGAMTYCMIKLVSDPLLNAIGTNVVTLCLELCVGILFYAVMLWFWCAKSRTPEFLVIFDRVGEFPQRLRKLSLTDKLNASIPRKHFSIRDWLEQSYRGTVGRPWVGYLDIRQRKIAAAFLTYVSYAIWLFFAILYSSFLAQWVPIFPISALCALMLLVGEAIAGGRNTKTILANIALIGFVCITSIIFLPSIAWGGAVIIFAFFARNYKLDDFARITLIATSLGLMVVVVSAQADIIENRLDDYGRIRYLLGFLGALYPSMYALTITLITVFLSKKNMGLTKAFALLVMCLFFYVETESRLSFALSVLIIGLSLIISAADRKGYAFKLPPLVASSIFIVCMIASVAVACLFDPADPLWASLDAWSGGRLTLSQDGLIDNNITWFGQEVGNSGNGLNPFGICETDTYDYIDNAYIKLLVSWGIIWTLFYMTAWTVSMYFACKTKDPYLVMCLVTIALHCIIHDLCLQLYYDPFLLVSGFAIMSLLKSREHLPQPATPQAPPLA